MRASERRPTSMFNNDDFPTLERPANAISGSIPLGNCDGCAALITNSILFGVIIGGVCYSSSSSSSIYRLQSRLFARRSFSGGIFFFRSRDRSSSFPRRSVSVFRPPPPGRVFLRSSRGRRVPSPPADDPELNLPPVSPRPESDPEPPRGGGAESRPRASLHIRFRPIHSVPFNPSIAFSAASRVSILTKANPRERPVSRSSTMETEATSPYDPNRSFRPSSVAVKGMFPT